MLPPVYYAGTSSTLIHFLVGSSRIEGSVTIDDALIEKKYSHVNENRISFEVNINNPPAPASAKKFLFELLEAKTIGDNVENIKTHGDSTEDIYVQMFGFLAFAAHPDGAKKC